MATKAPNYDINYDDKRLTDINSQKRGAIDEVAKTYGDMIGNVGEQYEALADSTKKWTEDQTKFQKEQGDLAIKKLEQEKQYAHDDYLKEQSGAYADWRKQSNEYGVEAEKMASQGLSRTGFSESAQVSFYNTYQQRVMTARDAWTRSKTAYDTAMAEAKIQNNAALAKIAYEGHQAELQLIIEGMQYENTLLLDQMNKKLEVDQMYYSRWRDEIAQINQENALAEQVRQFNKNYDEQVRQYNQDYAEQVRQFNANLAEEKRQFDKNYSLDERATAVSERNASVSEKELKLAQDKFDYEKKGSGSYSLGGGGGSSGGTGGSSSKYKYGDNMLFQRNYEVNTPYYQGAKNKDAGTYGTFSNGYQPKGISGHGKVSKTGDTFVMETEYSNGQKVKVEQNIWKTPDGKLWYWEGRENKYKSFKG